jgi:excisionase family DNA binding protein
MEEDIRIGAAATALGVSIDTLRRWEQRGQIRFERRGSQRYLPHDELARVLRERAAADRGTVPNRLPGIVVGVDRTGATAEVLLACGAFRVVAAMPSEAVDRLSLRPGDSAVAVVSASTVAVERA